MRIFRYITLIVTLLGSSLKADVPMPVELVYFEGSAIENGAHLIWGTATELNNYGFEIHRSINQAAFENVGFVFGHGTSYAPHDYEFYDTGLVYSGTYRYFLKQIDNDGQFKHTDTISINIISNIITTINYFQIESITNGASLTWGTTVEVNNYGFAIFRSINQSQFDSIGFVNGHGTSIEPWNYSFNDTGFVVSGVYSYYLEQIDTNGDVRNSDTLSIDFLVSIRNADQRVNEFSLSQNYPNPFNPSTKIRFSIPSEFNVAQNVFIQLFDLLGNEVATLINEYKAPGNYEIEINADKYGLSSGVYFYKLQHGNFSVTRKLILQK
jgi:hypothetical protein